LNDRALEEQSNQAAIARSRRAADHDAALSAVMTGLTDPFMIPYALALGASPFQAGLLSSVRNLLLAFVQLGSAEAVRRLGSRRAVVLWTAGLQAALWLPLAFVQPLFGDGAVLALIAAYTVGTASAALGGPAWGSLVADYTPPAERGRYFGRRARLAGFATTAAGAVAGGVLQLSGSRPLAGFGALCLLAAVARAFSWRALSQFYDAGWIDDPKQRTSFSAFLFRARHSNFTRFSLCIGLNSLAAHVAAPFFAVYLLEGLGFGYAEYTAVVLAGSLTGMLSSPWWGRLGDRHGNHAVLRWTSAGVVILPALWLLFGAPVWMLLWNVAGAFLWGGLNLSASNFVYDAVSPQRRPSYIAYFNVVNGIGVSLGAFVGSWIALAAESEGAAQAFVPVFVASIALRAAAALALRRFVREVRPVRDLGLREVILDLVGQRLVGVLGLFSVKPEVEMGPRRPGTSRARHAPKRSKRRARAAAHPGDDADAP